MTLRIFSSDELEVCEEVGRGAFGIVFRGIVKASNEEVAIKQIDLEKEETDLFEVNKEISIISECKLPQITQFRGCFAKNYKLWVIMEYVNGGSLFELLKPGPVTNEMVISIIVKEILIALEYLHGQGKIHRDLKSQNILLNKKGEVKLTDFGVSTQLSSNFSRRNTTVGTPYWMAPEVIMNNNGGHSYKADLWSLGCCAYELFNGKPPLQSQYPPMKALRKISECTKAEDFLELICIEELEMSNIFKDFLYKCFLIDPKERYSASKLLKHKFITKYNNSPNCQKLLKQLITNKQIWDQENHVTKTHNFYVPTEMSKNQKKWNGEDDAQKTIHFDISSIECLPALSHSTPSPASSKKSTTRESSLSPVEASRLKSNHTATPITYNDLEQKNTKQNNFKKILQPELNKIINKVFNKLETKNHLTTEQYDLLVKLNENIINLNSFVRLAENSSQISTQKLLICQYFKYFLKELTKSTSDANDSNNTKSVLQKLIIPSNFTINKTSNDTIMTTLRKSYKPQTQFDEIEGSLFESWIDKMNERTFNKL